MLYIYYSTGTIYIVRTQVHYSLGIHSFGIYKREIECMSFRDSLVVKTLKNGGIIFWSAIESLMDVLGSYIILHLLQHPACAESASAESDLSFLLVRTVVFIQGQS
jgi:hypothetical protein